METTENNQNTENTGQIRGEYDRITTPEELRRLPVEQLPKVADMLRGKIIDALSKNPGHFASSMGAVELTIALHYVFNTPEDRIVWDVGHQAYAHKLLTGRADRFSSLRTLGGLSGFPSPRESEYDTFVAGHASNSISAALGMAIADSLEGRKNKTVAVIGDASISGGLAFEGLNNVSNNPNNLLIILNDNEMSIDEGTGALHKYLTELTTSARYNRWRYNAYNFSKRHGLMTDKKKGRLLRLNNSLKAFISGEQNIFEGLNIRYFGPFDGHDIAKLIEVLNNIKDMKGPRLLHIRTIKGKGFEEAEKHPTIWHAPGKFDPATGERLKKSGGAEPPKWQDVFGETLVELADDDKDIVAITAAMPSGTSVSKMLAKYPKRTFDVGISEGHAVTFAGGLAAAGKKPFVAIYSSFLQRAYDNIIHDVAIQGLPVTFCIDRAGIVGEDGVTHHGMFDLAYLNCIPGMSIAAPADEETLRNLLFTAKDYPSPLAIRYPRGGATTPDWHTPMRALTPGKGREIRNNGSKIAVLTIGPELSDALKAADIVKESDGIDVDIYDMIWLKPLDEDLLRKIAATHSEIITIEDGSVRGGFGSTVREWLDKNDADCRVTSLGAPDNWVHHGTVAQLKQICGYDTQAIADAIRNAAETNVSK